jgi:cytochrome P450
MPQHQDSFEEARVTSGIQFTEFNGECIPFILRLKELRKTAKNWKEFSSDNPFQVVPHSEEGLRSMRQIPIEMDPPQHTDFRALVEPFFIRPTHADYIEDMAKMVTSMVANIIDVGEVEAVNQFALPLQCRALAMLLKVPDSEADRWMEWGMHALTEGSGLEDYTAEQFARAEREPGDDFFSMLNRAEMNGEKLSFTEKQGIANVTFAGGKDTVINVVSSIIVYFSEHPKALGFLGEDERYIMTACEEFVRYVSPLTAITRTCPHTARVADHEIPAGGRVGLCWPSANRDESVFKEPNKVVLDRMPNPHIGFGFGIHNCLGAPQARLIIRCLLKSLCKQVKSINLISSEPRIEKEESYTRQVGYDRVVVKIS